VTIDFAMHCFMWFFVYRVVCVDTVKGKGNCIAVHGTPSHSYVVSLAIWDHTVLPSTRHK